MKIPAWLRGLSVRPFGREKSVSYTVKADWEYTLKRWAKRWFGRKS